MSRVLILKFGAIGDVIMAIPAAHQLHLAGHPVDRRPRRTLRSKPE